MDCILIVEDDKKISRIIELQLNHAGFETVKAFNGREAIDVFNNTPDIGLVLLDIMLPQFNGYEVLKYIRERSPELPVIFLTAKDDTGDVVNGLNLGADDYITKPFIFDELLARIKANLRKKPLSRPGTELPLKTCPSTSILLWLAAGARASSFQKQSLTFCTTLCSTTGWSSPGNKFWTRCGALTILEMTIS